MTTADRIIDDDHQDDHLAGPEELFAPEHDFGVARGTGLRVIAGQALVDLPAGPPIRHIA